MTLKNIRDNFQCESCQYNRGIINGDREKMVACEFKQKNIN